MSIVYTVSKGGATMQVGYRAIGPTLGLYTYDQRRGFIPFDLPGAGISSGSVESAQLILVCTGTTGGGCTIKLTVSTETNGFGATLDAIHDDWASTTTYDEGDLAVTSTGTKTWNVDPAHLSYTEVTHFRLKNIDEGAGATYNKNSRFASNDSASNKPILRLTLFSGQVIFVNAL